jgi:hypothetical protein
VKTKLKELWKKFNKIYGSIDLEILIINLMAKTFVLSDKPDLPRIFQPTGVESSVLN